MRHQGLFTGSERGINCYIKADFKELCNFVLFLEKTIMLLYIVSFAACLCHIAHCNGSNFTLEFEHAAERENQNFRAMWRQDASKSKTLLLYEGDYVVLDFCLSSQTTVDITNLRFSNDGPSDNVTFFVDGIPIGSFETFAFTDWGRMWNVFQNSGPVGSSVTIHPGNHELNISISESDNYGVEFDSLQFTLDNEVSEEIFLCQQELKEHVMFNDIFTPIEHDSKGQKTHLMQHSYESNCLDESNVQICFNTSNWVGVQFYATSEYLNNTGVGDEWQKAMLNANTCGVDEHTIWTIGIDDFQNLEFGAVDHTKKKIEVSIPKVLENLAVIPREISNPSDTSFEISFKMSQSVIDVYPWALFTLGALEPEDVRVSVQFFDYRVNSISSKDTKVLSYDNSIEQFYIPTEALSNSLDNTIKLTFEGTVNRLGIDFMKLDAEERSKNESSDTIFENRFMKIRGVSEPFDKSPGMMVSTNDETLVSNLHRFSIMARKGRRATFAKILTVHSDGRIYMHTLAERRHFVDLFPKLLSEASGFQFRPRYKDQSVFIQQVEIEPSDLVMNITYSDGSKVMFRFSLVGDQTKLVIFDIFQAPDAQQDVFGCYFSKVHGNEMAAVDDLTIDKTDSYKVLDRKIDNLSGNTFTFDHEFATWYVSVGSDLVAAF